MTQWFIKTRAQGFTPGMLARLALDAMLTLRVGQHEFIKKRTVLFGTAPVQGIGIQALVATPITRGGCGVHALLLLLDSNICNPRPADCLCVTGRRGAMLEITCCECCLLTESETITYNQGTTISYRSLEVPGQLSSALTYPLASCSLARDSKIPFSSKPK